MSQSKKSGEVWIGRAGTDRTMGISWRQSELTHRADAKEMMAVKKKKSRGIQRREKKKGTSTPGRRKEMMLGTEGRGAKDNPKRQEGQTKENTPVEGDRERNEGLEREERSAMRANGSKGAK